VKKKEQKHASEKDDEKIACFVCITLGLVFFFLLFPSL